MSCRLRLTQRVLRSSRRTAGALLLLPKEVINRLHTRDGEPLFLNRSFGGWLPAHALRSRLRRKNGEGGHHRPLPQYTPRSGKVKAPVWIDERDALALHNRLLALHGGGVGLRDDGLLKSALAWPRNSTSPVPSLWGNFELTADVAAVRLVVD